MKFALNIKQKGFNDCQGINSQFNFFQKLDLSVFVNLEKNFSPDTLGVNFEVLKLHLCMYYCEVCFKW